MDLGRRAMRPRVAAVLLYAARSRVARDHDRAALADQ